MKDVRQFRTSFKGLALVFACVVGLGTVGGLLRKKPGPDLAGGTVGVLPVEPHQSPLPEPPPDKESKPEDRPAVSKSEPGTPVPVSLEGWEQYAVDVAGEDDGAKFLSGVRTIKTGLGKFKLGEASRVWSALVKALKQRPRNATDWMKFSSVAADLHKETADIRSFGSSTVWFDILGGISPRLGSPDLDAFKASLAEHPGDPFCRDLESSRLLTEFCNDPKRSLGRLETIQDAGVRERIETSVLRNLRSLDHAAAVEFLLGEKCKLPPKPSLMASIVGDYLRFKPEAASALIGAAPPSDRKDQAILLLLKTWGANDPEVISKWSAQFHDERVRAEALVWLNAGGAITPARGE